MIEENRKYLILLESGGDIDIKLVNKETWDYIHSSRPDFGNESCIDEQLPEGVESYEEDPKIINVTCGSWENDRAIYVKGQEFGSLKDYTKYIQNNNIEIIDEYIGCIY